MRDMASAPAAPAKPRSPQSYVNTTGRQSVSDEMTAEERSRAAGVRPVAMVDRLAYVLREWEESHAEWRQPHINGSEWNNDPGVDEHGRQREPYRYPREKWKECECRHCQDARTVLA